MPDELVAVRQLDDIGGLAVRLVEEQEENLSRILRVNGKIHPLRGEGSPEREVSAFLDCFRSAMPEFVWHLTSFPDMGPMDRTFHVRMRR